MLWWSLTWRYILGLSCRRLQLVTVGDEGTEKTNVCRLFHESVSVLVAGLGHGRSYELIHGIKLKDCLSGAFLLVSGSMSLRR